MIIGNLLASQLEIRLPCGADENEIEYRIGSETWQTMAPHQFDELYNFVQLMNEVRGTAKAEVLEAFYEKIMHQELPKPGPKGTGGNDV